MRLMVLGSAASYAGPGQACSGHLVEGGGARVLFDCGNGVLSNLGKVMDPFGLDAIFISHAHPDHFADLYAFNSLLRYAPSGPRPPMAVYGPEGLFDEMCGGVTPSMAKDILKAFVQVTLAEGEPIVLGGMKVTPRGVDHIKPAFGFIIEADCARLSYTSDTAPGERVRAIARGADLLLAEATLPEEYAGRAPHMTASEAGALAREAGAGELVMAHIWATNDRPLMARLAAEQFGGPVTVASEFDTFMVRGKTGEDR